jgi:hypothetical protein
MTMATDAGPQSVAAKIEPSNWDRNGTGMWSGCPALLTELENTNHPISPPSTYHRHRMP